MNDLDYLAEVAKLAGKYDLIITLRAQLMAEEAAIETRRLEIEELHNGQKTEEA